MLEKFRANAGLALTEEAAEALADDTLSLDERDNVGAVLAPLRRS